MELVISQNITLDRVVDASEGWSSAGDGEEGSLDDVAAVLMEQTAREAAFLCGRRTFEELRGYWPGQLGMHTSGVAESLQRVDEHVVSRTLGDPGWERTTVIDAEDPLAAIAELKASRPDADGDVVVTPRQAAVARRLPPGRARARRRAALPLGHRAADVPPAG